LTGQAYADHSGLGREKTKFTNGSLQQPHANGTDPPDTPGSQSWTGKKFLIFDNSYFTFWAILMMTRLFPADIFFDQICRQSFLPAAVLLLQTKNQKNPFFTKEHNKSQRRNPKPADGSHIRIIIIIDEVSFRFHFLPPFIANELGFGPSLSQSPRVDAMELCK
jgi:hypothetical protein